MCADKNKLYGIGIRHYQIITSQMRMGFCDLRYDLYRRLCVESPLCACGEQEETIDHYFFDCRLYELERHELFDTLYDILASHDVDFNIETLLSGSKSLNFNTNKKVTYAVHNYIQSTKRFG